MAYVRAYNPNDDQSETTGQVRGINNFNPLLLSQSSAPVDSSSQQSLKTNPNVQKAASGDFTNIQKYLSSNREGAENLGQSVASNLNQTGYDAANATNTATSGFNNKVGSNTNIYNPDVLNSAANDASNYETNPTLLTQLSGTYAGPTSYTGSEEDVAASKAVNKGIETRDLSQNASGRTQLLRNIYNSSSAPVQTTTGGLNLNQFLLQNTPDAYNKVNTAANALKPLESTYNNISTSSNNLATNAAKTNLATKGQALARLNQGTLDLQGIIDGAKTSSQNQLKDWAKTTPIASDWALAQLGISQAQYGDIMRRNSEARALGRPGIDLSTFMPIPTLGTADVATTKQKADLGALSRLTGNSSNFLQAGTTGSKTPFDLTSALAALTAQIGVPVVANPTTPTPTPGGNVVAGPSVPTGTGAVTLPSVTTPTVVGPAPAPAPAPTVVGPAPSPTPGNVVVGGGVTIGPVGQGSPTGGNNYGDFGAGPHVPPSYDTPANQAPVVSTNPATSGNAVGDGTQGSLGGVSINSDGVASGVTTGVGSGVASTIGNVISGLTGIPMLGPIFGLVNTLVNNTATTAANNVNIATSDTNPNKNGTVTNAPTATAGVNGTGYTAAQAGADAAAAASSMGYSDAAIGAASQAAADATLAGKSPEDARDAAISAANATTSAQQNEANAAAAAGAAAAAAAEAAEAAPAPAPTPSYSAEEAGMIGDAAMRTAENEGLGADKQIAAREAAINAINAGMTKDQAMAAGATAAVNSGSFFGYNSPGNQPGSWGNMGGTSGNLGGGYNKGSVGGFGGGMSNMA